MATTFQLMALFTDVTPVVDLLDELRKQNIDDDDLTVISGVPLSPEILGRPTPPARVPIFGMLGALGGLSTALFFNVGTPLLYAIRVGGQPLIPIPTSAVLTFELTMLGLLVGTFLGVMWTIRLPTARRRPYDSRVADGHIGVLLLCTKDQVDDLRTLMLARGAEEVIVPEGQML